MRYEEYHTVGEVTKSKDYEGTPEEIRKLMEYQKKLEQPCAEETKEQESPDPSEFRKG